MCLCLSLRYETDKSECTKTNALFCVYLCMRGKATARERKSVLSEVGLSLS